MADEENNVSVEEPVEEPKRQVNVKTATVTKQYNNQAAYIKAKPSLAFGKIYSYIGDDGKEHLVQVKRVKKDVKNNPKGKAFTELGSRDPVSKATKTASKIDEATFNRGPVEITGSEYPRVFNSHKEAMTFIDNNKSKFPKDYKVYFKDTQGKNGSKVLYKAVVLGDKLKTVIADDQERISNLETATKYDLSSKSNNMFKGLSKYEENASALTEEAAKVVNTDAAKEHPDVVRAKEILSSPEKMTPANFIELRHAHNETQLQALARQGKLHIGGYYKITIGGNARYYFVAPNFGENYIHDSKDQSISDLVEVDKQGRAIKTLDVLPMHEQTAVQKSLERARTEKFYDLAFDKLDIQVSDEMKRRKALEKSGMTESPDEFSISKELKDEVTAANKTILDNKDANQKHRMIKRAFVDESAVDFMKLEEMAANHKKQGLSKHKDMSDVTKQTEKLVAEENKPTIHKFKTWDDYFKNEQGATEEFQAIKEGDLIRIEETGEYNKIEKFKGDGTAVRSEVDENGNYKESEENRVKGRTEETTETPKAGEETKSTSETPKPESTPENNQIKPTVRARNYSSLAEVNKAYFRGELQPNEHFSIGSGSDIQYGLLTKDETIKLSETPAEGVVYDKLHIKPGGESYMDNKSDAEEPAKSTPKEEPTPEETAKQKQEARFKQLIEDGKKGKVVFESEKEFNDFFDYQKQTGNKFQIPQGTEVHIKGADPSDAHFKRVNNHWLKTDEKGNILDNEANRSKGWRPEGEAKEEPVHNVKNPKVVEDINSLKGIGNDELIFVKSEDSYYKGVTGADGNQVFVETNADGETIKGGRYFYEDKSGTIVGGNDRSRGTVNNDEEVVDENTGKKSWKEKISNVASKTKTGLVRTWDDITSGKIKEFASEDEVNTAKANGELKPKDRVSFVDEKGNTHVNVVEKDGSLKETSVPLGASKSYAHVFDNQEQAEKWVAKNKAKVGSTIRLSDTGKEFRVGSNGVLTELTEPQTGLKGLSSVVPHSAKAGLSNAKRVAKEMAKGTVGYKPNAGVLANTGNAVKNLVKGGIIGVGTTAVSGLAAYNLRDTKEDFTPMERFAIDLVREHPGTAATLGLTAPYLGAMGGALIPVPGATAAGATLGTTLSLAIAAAQGANMAYEHLPSRADLLAQEQGGDLSNVPRTLTDEEVTALAKQNDGLVAKNTTTTDATEVGRQVLTPKQQKAALAYDLLSNFIGKDLTKPIILGNKAIIPSETGDVPSVIQLPTSKNTKTKQETPTGTRNTDTGRTIPAGRDDNNRVFYKDIDTNNEEYKKFVAAKNADMLRSLRDYVNSGLSQEEQERRAYADLVALGLVKQ